jgi:hypothetical protein
MQIGSGTSFPSFLALFGVRLTQNQQKSRFKGNAPRQTAREQCPHFAKIPHLELAILSLVEMIEIKPL